VRVALINTPSLATRAVSRSMAGGIGFDGGPAMLLMPLDLAVMAAALRDAGEMVSLIDADPLGLDVEATCRRLDGTSWDVLVATVSLPTVEQDAAFLRELRRRHPAARVFAKTLVREHAVLQQLLERSGCDLVIHGEADLSIVDLAHGRHRRGTAWLDGGTLRFEDAEPVADLDALPVAARDLLPGDRYVYPLLGAPVATLQTSRGCPYPCGYYCPYPLVEGVKWRAQSPERILAEMRAIVEGLGITKLYFRDATFTLNQGRIEKLCDLIVDAGWRLEWACETRIDCLGEPLLEKMRAAGCHSILVGVETGDEETMQHKEGKRGLTMSKLEHVREVTRRLGIRLHFLLIVGLPRDSRESIVDTYELIQRQEPDTIGVTTITPYPGTPLYAEAVAEGWIDTFEWQSYGGHQVPMHTPHLGREELVTGKRFLEEGFEILRQRLATRRPDLDEIAARHRDALLRWAYRLDEPAQSLAATARRLAAAAPPAPAPVAGSGLAVSVVIPTHDRRDILRRTLLAFSAQTIDPERFEVIVVDDGSTDDTPAMLARWRGGCTVRVVRQEHGGANAARNRGVAVATAPIVLLTGDDMIPGPSFLEEHLRFHQEHPDARDAMLGFIDWSPELPVTPLMRFLVSPAGGQQFAFHEIGGPLATYRNFYSSNVSLKREFLCAERVMFDEDFTATAYDDTELGYRLERRGMRLHYRPRAVTYHHHAMDIASFARRQTAAGRMAVVFAQKHPEQRGSLRVTEAERAGPVGRERLDRALAAAAEGERPDLSALSALATGNGSFADHYVGAVLHPLYRHVLDVAYLHGIQEGLASRPTLPAPAATVTAGRTRFDASIVIPLYNRADLSAQCLERLAEVTHDVGYEVILVDNASTDHTADVLAALGGDVRVIRNRENLGFARACNQGAAAASGRYVVFLNNDTIPLPGWLAALVREADDHPGVTVVGSKLLYPDDTIQHAGVVVGRLSHMPYHAYAKAPAGAACVNRRRELQVVTGACMLVRPEVFAALDGFDEGYRNGFEDVDFCFRVRERGGRVVYQPESTLYHLESQSPGRKALDETNAQRLRARWGEHWWLVDDDAVYVRDGYVCRTTRVGDRVGARVEPLPASERAAWEIVAATQEAAQRRDVPAVHALLADPSRWPADIPLLIWAIRISEASGAPHLAAGFERCIGRLEGQAPAFRPGAAGAHA
jgi:GT2 family glycosyltransferase/radical SAM superfamily enzyme YgiQ (UPF0313 family)